MKLSLLFAPTAFVVLAGCASAPPPPAQPPVEPAVTPDWVAEAAHRPTDFDFVSVAPKNAKAPGQSPALTAPLRVDSATGYDVKNTHLKAAAEHP